MSGHLAFSAPSIYYAIVPTKTVWTGMCKGRCECFQAFQEKVAMTKAVIQKSWTHPRTAFSWILVSSHGRKSEDGLILQMPVQQLQHLTFPNETETPRQLGRDAVFPPLSCFKNHSMVLEDLQQAASRAVIRPSAEPWAGDVNNSEHWWWKGRG